MNDLNERIANLSREKQTLLLNRLKKERGPESSLSRIPPSLREGGIPLSFAQERLWFLSLLEPNSPFYNISVALHLMGRFDRVSFEKTFAEIISRHEVLRTHFVQVAGQPCQKIIQDFDFTIPFTDLKGVADKQRMAAIRRWAALEAEQPFDLSKELLIRAKLLCLEQGQTEDEEEHLLVFTIHHIAFDGWSINVLIHEFATLYGAFCSGHTSPLPKLPLQYADFAIWQRVRLQGELLEKHLAYWRQHLAGAPSLLELPTDRPRPETLSYSGDAYTFLIPRELTESLRALSRQESVTLQMTLAAAFRVLLFRYSHQPDFCLGIPVANRLRPELEGMIGFFVNTLVLRTDLSGNPRFTELMARERQVSIAAQAYQDLPFEKLVEVLHPERHVNYNPLFQVMFTMLADTREKLEVPGMRISEIPMENRSAKFDLTLQILEREESLSATFEYSTELFLERTVIRMAEHWRQLLEGIVSAPKTRLSELPLLTASGLRLRVAWNATNALPPKQDSLHGLFECQAVRTPDAVAVVHKNQKHSYRLLNQRANQLAHALQRRAVLAEDRVGLYLVSGFEMIVGILAILKAGAAYVPIDPAYPTQRQHDILADSGAFLIITRSYHADALSLTDRELFCLDRLNFDSQPDSNPLTAVHPDHPAYLIYTSGSTGRPKGVVVSHANAVHSTTARFTYYETPVQSFLLLSSCAFDSSVAGIFWTLSQGGRLCIPSEDDRCDPAVLARLIIQEQVSHLLCLPSFYNLLLEQAETGQLDGLDTVIIAGEACPIQTVANHQAKLPSVKLYNEYGPTEATVWSSVYNIQPDDGGAQMLIPIGRPIANSQIHLLDAHLNPVPIGVAGEIYIGGLGITRGYHCQPGLTGERFVPDPFSATAGKRLYRTGDLARYREDGLIEFMGRIDHQLKIRGYRIEPGEIEARLLQHPDVKEAVVIAREDHPGIKRLTAYVVICSHAGTTADANPIGERIMASLKGSLPEYMIPSAFVVLEALPKTSNGKLDRKALPAPERHHSMVSQSVMPRNAVEEELLRLWRKVLGAETIGVHDNFFSLGGYSMLVVQLSFSIRDTFKVELPLRTLLERTTIAEQAQLLSGDPLVLVDTAPMPMNWEAEAEFDPGFPIAPIRKAFDAEPSSILLTGATGFLGAFLLRDLLQETSADIYCLVRGESREKAALRLRQVLDRYGLNSIADNQRIIPMPGDLSKSALGLSTLRFNELSHEIDTIYHNGAVVNFTAGYESLKHSNVFGTREVLRLACLGKPKAVHYVSTVSIFGDRMSTRQTGFVEEDFPVADEKLSGGYAQSKWVAERMVRLAGEKGLPVNIYRPSSIIGDSCSGVWNSEDALCRMITGFIELGWAPDLDESLDMVPVDYVSKAIVKLSRCIDSVGKTFHLTNGKAMSTSALIGEVREIGYPIQTIPLDRWVHQTVETIKHQPDHLLYPLLPLFEDWRVSNIQSGKGAGLYDCESTIETLKSLGMDYSQVLEKPGRIIINYLLKNIFNPSVRQGNHL
jgi:myxalamid-type nonribosomal peptide synthetase MxaA